MGMAGGAYKGDKERAQLALQASQIANQRAQAQESARLRQMELLQRQKAREDAKAQTDREMALRERQMGMENELRNRQLDATIAHQERADAIAARASERADMLLQQKLAQQSQIYGGYEQLERTARAQREQKQALGASAVASVMKLAMRSGGKNDKGEYQKGAVPMYALEALNRDMGFDGKNQGFVAGGYTQNGDFYLQYAQRDPQTGQMVSRPQVMSRMDQYKVMHQQQGIFDNSDRGAMAAELRSAGFRDDEILLASGINQTQLEQMRKLASAKQTQETSMKERLSGLNMIKDFLDKNGADLDEQTMTGLKAAYQNGIQQIAAQYAPKQPEPGVNEPSLNEDGSLTLPNGTTLKKDQEYTNPQDGKKYIWRGGDAKNFEAVESANPETTPPKSADQKRYEGNKLNNDAFDDVFSGPLTHPEVANEALRQQGGYKPEDASQEPGIGPRNSNLPDDETAPQGGMAGGAQTVAAPVPPQDGGGGGMAGGAQNAGGADMQRMFERLKANGVLDDDMTMEQFMAMTAEEEEMAAAAAAEGGGE